jgi:hypothetical protein
MLTRLSTEMREIFWLVIAAGGLTAAGTMLAVVATLALEHLA